MCLRQDDFHVGPEDVLLGIVEDCPIFVCPHQAYYWVNSVATIAVTEGGGNSFSLEAPQGVRFLVRASAVKPA